MCCSIHDAGRGRCYSYTQQVTVLLQAAAHWTEGEGDHRAIPILKQLTTLLQPTVLEEDITQTSGLTMDGTWNQQRTAIGEQSSYIWFLLKTKLLSCLTGEWMKWVTDHCLTYLGSLDYVILRLFGSKSRICGSSRRGAWTVPCCACHHVAGFSSNCSINNMIYKQYNNHVIYDIQEIVDATN